MKLSLNINNFTNFSIIDTYFENIKIKEILRTGWP